MDLFIFRGNGDYIGYPIRMLLFPDETKVYELFHLCFDCFHDLGMELSLLLFAWFGVRIDVETMHSNLEIEPGHVLIIPSEDIYLLSYELY